MPAYISTAFCTLTGIANGMAVAHVQTVTIKDAFLVALGILLIAFPRVIVLPYLRMRERRLTRLRSGAMKERYFEERRTLEAYQPARSLVAWRFIGLGLMLLGTSGLYLTA